MSHSTGGRFLNSEGHQDDSPDNQLQVDHNDNHHNVFDHSPQYNENDLEASSGTGPSQDDAKPDPMTPQQPVLCASPSSIQSAFLVRMVGEPSSMTRYEKRTLEQVVMDSYNQWMMGTCDGYHRTMTRVELRPIQDFHTISQAHDETLKAEESYHQQLLQPQPEEGANVESAYEDYLQPAQELYDEDGNRYRITEAPSASPTTDLRYMPLYWLSVRASCRNCPRTSRGNSNLLASHAQQWRNATDSNQRTDEGHSLSAADLILEEICYCPASVGRGIVSNGTTIETNTLEMLFPEAEAPTSLDLVESINLQIQDLRASRRLLHVESLAQLTEPDYAYYALEMERMQELEATDSDLDSHVVVEPMGNSTNKGNDIEAEDESTPSSLESESGHQSLNSTTQGEGASANSATMVPPSNTSQATTTPAPSTAPPEEDEELGEASFDGAPSEAIKATRCKIVVLVTLGTLATTLL